MTKVSRKIQEGDRCDPVSYTHLDVYKRQERQEPYQGFPTDASVGPNINNNENENLNGRRQW